MGGALFFDEAVDFRLRKLDLRVMEKIVKKDSEKYDNLSHFFRVASLKLMREEKARLKL